MDIAFLMMQNVLLKIENKIKFQQLIKYFEASRTIVNLKIMTRKSKGLSYKSIKHPATSDLKLEYFNSLKLPVKFNGSFL